MSARARYATCRYNSDDVILNVIVEIFLTLLEGGFNKTTLYNRVWLHWDGHWRFVCVLMFGNNCVQLLNYLLMKAISYNFIKREFTFNLSWDNIQLHKPSDTVCLGIYPNLTEDIHVHVYLIFVTIGPWHNKSGRFLYIITYRLM